MSSGGRQRGTAGSGPGGRRDGRSECRPVGGNGALLEAVAEGEEQPDRRLVSDAPLSRGYRPPGEVPAPPAAGGASRAPQRGIRLWRRFDRVELAAVVR